tara:strand:+ start:1578 stop:1997 length:420 start_codon:yes stop_codon:yes gene_type:complete
MTKTYKKRNKRKGTKKNKKRKYKKKSRRKRTKRKGRKRKTRKLRGGGMKNESILRKKFENIVREWVHKKPIAMIKYTRKKLPTRYFKDGKNYKNPLHNIFSQILGSLMDPMASLNKVQDDMKKQIKSETNKMKRDLTKF